MINLYVRNDFFYLNIDFWRGGTFSGNKPRCFCVYSRAIKKAARTGQLFFKNEGISSFFRKQFRLSITYCLKSNNA